MKLANFYLNFLLANRFLIPNRQKSHQMINNNCIKISILIKIILIKIKYNE